VNIFFVQVQVHIHPDSDPILLHAILELMPRDAKEVLTHPFFSLSMSTRTSFLIIIVKQRNVVTSSVFTASQAVDTYAEDLGFMLSWANVTVFDTDDGLVLVDCGSPAHGERIYVRE
jgi:hypothetical protein